jgi:hypothetical protein
MPIPWLTVLTSVPWSEVIANAPKVAEGARKLWKAVGRKAPSAEESVQAMPENALPESRTVAALARRVHALETDLADLQAQMLASSELIKALADQNEQLVRRIDANRVRLLWLGALAAVFAAVAVLALLAPFSGSAA